ncbi:MAG: FtsX-like permease family protein [Nitrospirae bacterium]|nr:FtsX-like permease family protein [Nitrospirota bacterium]
MKNHFRILEFTLSSLLRKKYKNLSLVFIYSIIIAVVSSLLFLTQAYKKEAMDVFIADPELIVQRLLGGRHDLIPVGYVSKIMAIPGVSGVEPRYWGYYFDTLTGANYTLIAGSTSKGSRFRTSRNDEGGSTVNELHMIKGAPPKGPGECAIGKGVADARLVDLGDLLFLSLNSEELPEAPHQAPRQQKVSLKVTGIFTAESAILTNDLVVMDKSDLINFFALPKDSATDLMVRVGNPSEIPTIAMKIKRYLPDTRPITRPEIIRTYENVFNWRSGMVLTMFIGPLLAFAIFAWDKATGMSAGEKQEIGVLKAIGWETADVLKMKFWEGLTVSLTSFLTGLILAYVHVFYFGAALFAPVLKGWSVLFPPFNPIPDIDLYQIFVVFFLTVIPYLASTIIPSWKAAITDPDTVMRN